MSSKESLRNGRERMSKTVIKMIVMMCMTKAPSLINHDNQNLIHHSNHKNQSLRQLLLILIHRTTNTDEVCIFLEVQSDSADLHATLF